MAAGVGVVAEGLPHCHLPDGDLHMGLKHALFLRLELAYPFGKRVEPVAYHVLADAYPVAFLASFLQLGDFERPIIAGVLLQDLQQREIELGPDLLPHVHTPSARFSAGFTA